jgi:NADH-quinone oxidoreductase subunit G
MATIYVDDTPYEVEDGQNLLQACLSVGLDLPYFCWHPAMGSVAACRQCAVKLFEDENDTQGTIVMACITPATNGTRISIDDPEAREFRARVIEWLMTNHPHDCPVCDEGGECHLQDMTVMTGHTYREFRFKKRTHRNQDLGPFIEHEMNRCIQCYRCVRFYRDYAGGFDFDVFASHNHVYFGRHEDGVLENEFSGNLIEICPTGVFTDKTFNRHYSRKWDLQTAPSVCVHCGLGCNTIPGERYGQLRRIRNRYDHEVNEYFLCDRGRFGYEFVNSDRRIRHARLRNDRGAESQLLTKEAAVEHVASLLANEGRVMGIGSPRASLEANFALRALVGPERFYLGISQRDCRLLSTALEILQRGPAPAASLREVRMSDAILVLGEDVTNVAPLLALALRQSVRRKPIKAAEERLGIAEWEDLAVREAIQRQEGPLITAICVDTRLDDLATKIYRAAPDDLARLGFAVAHALNSRAPSVPDISRELESLAAEVAQLLSQAERPLVVSGTTCGSEAVMKAAANVAWALCDRCPTTGLCLTVPECNSLGMALLGGNDLQAALGAAETDGVDALIVLENDLYRRAEAASIDALLETAGEVIAIDHLENSTSSKVDVVLPASTFAEADGTYVNNETRPQRFFQVFVPEGDVQESWRWLRDIMVAADRPEAKGWQTLDDVMAALAKEIPALEPILGVAPSADFRMVGQKIPRQSPRYTGRTAMRANIDVHEAKPPGDPDSALSFSMEGYEGQPPPPLVARFWAPAWNSVQSLNKFQSEVGGPLRGSHPGQRLIQPSDATTTSFFDEVPSAFRRRENEWLIVPLYHIFGSEELSALAGGTSELAQQPYLALHPEDAVLLQAADCKELALVMGPVEYRLPVRLVPSLPRGVAGLPVGLPGVQATDLPAWGRIART